MEFTKMDDEQRKAFILIVSHFVLTVIDYANNLQQQNEIEQRQGSRLDMRLLTL